MFIVIGRSKCQQSESKIINIDRGNWSCLCSSHLMSTSPHPPPPPLSLSFLLLPPPHSWLCHIDDDIYVNLKQLVKFLSKFDPKKEAVYFGRSGSGWETPRKVVEGALYGKPGQKYHFAVGGMYCLSRPILEMSKPYLM